MRVQLRYLFGDLNYIKYFNYLTHGVCTRNSRLTRLFKVHSDGLFLVSAVREFQALTAR